MGTVAVLTFVSSTCIISMHVARYFKPNRQDLVFFLVEDIVAFSDDIVDFTRRYIDTKFQQLLPDEGLGDMSVIVLIQNKADQC